MTVSLSPVLTAGAFTPPGPSIFELPPVFTIAGIGVTKPMLLLVVAAVSVFAFLFASAKPAMVPGKLQFAGEAAYGFVRNTVARDIIGGRDFRPFVPYLTALFFFVLLNNWFGSIPFIQFPPFSRSGMAYALAGLSWVVYNAVGVRRHGVLGYLKHQTVPHGVSPVLYPLLVPLEFLSNIVVRPVTLALRLFANMFAGHILLVLFSTGGLYLITEQGLIGLLAGPVAFIMFILVSFLELLVQFLQAYVFVLLNATYIAGALAEEH